MRKFLMTMLLSMGMIGAWADGYGYLVLVSQASGGTVTLSSIASDGLTITFADGTMVLTPADGDVKSLPVDELQMMYFSETAEGGEIVTPTMIEETLSQMEQQEVDVYGIDGSFLGHFGNLQQAKAVLQHGAYLVSSNEKTVKIAVK